MDAGEAPHGTEDDRNMTAMVHGTAAGRGLTMNRTRWVRNGLWVLLVTWLMCPAAPGQPPLPPARRPDVWAIVVGVGNYAHAAIPDSRTTPRDAGEVLRWIRRAGWAGRQQLLLSDFGASGPGDPDNPAPNILPIKRNLDWAFQQWLFPKAKPGDIVVVYFAGQSRAVVKPEGAQIDPRVDYYLLPTDAVAEQPELNGWSLDEAVDGCVRRKLQVVCWLATSIPVRVGPIPPPPRPAAGQSGAAVGGAGRGQPRPPNPTGANWLGRLTRWPGVTAWLASDRPQVPGAIAEPGNAFTKALLESLGKPDPQRKGKPNLAACLKDLRQNRQLELQGFCSVGGVPPGLTLWANEIGKQTTPPKPELVLQVGHADKLTALVAPADGRLVLSASMDSTVRVWSTPERARSLLRVLPGQTVGVTALALSRDEKWLISGGGRGSVLVYDRDHDFALQLLAARQPHNERINQIALLPDGFHFVSVDRDGRSFLWDPRQSPLAPQPWLEGVDCLEVACGGRREPDGQDTGLVLARGGDGRVRTFDSLGSGGVVLELPHRDPTTLAASADGRRVAVGFSDGRVVVRNYREAQGWSEFRVEVGGRPVAVRQLVFSPSGKLAVGHEKGARLLTLTPHPPAAAAAGLDLIDQPLQGLVFSPNGHFLAACTENIGALRVWRIDGDDPPSVVQNDAAANAYLLGFTANSRGLFFGDFYGALAFRPLDPQGDEVPWTFPANRGKVQQLSATPSRRFLLFVDEMKQARFWDLKDRSCRRLQGTFSAGVFLDDNRLVLAPDSSGGEHAGRLVLVDRDKLKPHPEFFARAAGSFKISDALPFERVVLSPDGTRIAAASDASKEPMVCVWEIKTGRLTHWVSSPRLEDPVLALSFSSDSRYLLTAGDSPAAQLWDLTARQGELELPCATFADPAVRNNIKCALIRPNHTDLQVVTGHSDGQVHLWSWTEGKAKLEVQQLVAGVFAGFVKALCFTSDGQYLAAAGDGTVIWVGSMDPQPQSIKILDALRPHHYEQINALTTWKDQPILLSGSDDTTVRFWDLKNGTLWGTFSAATQPAVSDAAVIQELDWVLYTPDGLYDAPPTATKLVQYRRQDRPQQLDQFEKTHSTFRLSEQLLRGENPRLQRQPEEPPPVSISVPPRSDPTIPQTRLTITLGANDPKEIRDVRLYHNDILVPCGWDEHRVRLPKTASFDVVVRLLPKPKRNRFYVMASRDGAYDSCSPVVEVDYTGPMEPARLHILALGVDGYERRRLHYARRDAERLSQVLHARGVDTAGQGGVLDVLFDDEVSAESVKRAFDRIAERVETRPQDTVVVFLAGHTGVFDPQRFCLLLPSYPFPADEPLLVAARDVIPNAEIGNKVDLRHVLPYSVVSVNLMRLKALNRLVIVDACQAEAILADPQVRAIQKWMEVTSRSVRTSYLMAARRGEPALEVEPLGHGLFTYTLLRGMGAVPLGQEPKEVLELNLPHNADFNRDGILSTSELDAYAKQVLPQLAAVFPQLVANRRAVEGNRGAPAAPAPEPKLDQEARIQSAEVSFPLVPLGEVQRP
jgi:WD40 repeat protein/uncharacterized caspase-like protein